MKKLLFWALLLIALAYLILYRTATFFPDRQIHPTNHLQTAKINSIANQLDAKMVTEHLAQAIRLPTISFDNQQTEPTYFLELHSLLESAFPLVSQHSEKTIINQNSLILKFSGSNPALKPILLMGHMDVVPIDPITDTQWQYPPFSGHIDDQFVWGRGTLDDKSTIMALMEAMELVLKNQLRLQRTVYFSFGHDEEIGGQQGAKAIAEYFAAQGIKFEFVLDEGGVITQDLLNGFNQPIALIGVAEKGFVNIKMIAKADGGHSSLPPKQTAAGILAQAIVKLESNPFPTDLQFTQLLFDEIGYYADFKTRAVMANLWLTQPLVSQTLLNSPSSAAGLHTTTAVTMLQGSQKSNVLPSQAEAVVNFRIFPGETWQTVLARVQQVVDDQRIEFEVFMQNDPSPVSNHQTLAYQQIASTIRQISAETLVAPYLVPGGTDSKYFYSLSDQVFRFLMIRLTPESLHQFHGLNERIAINDYLDTIRFYLYLLDKAAIQS